MRGADNHDSLRGDGLNFVVLDEFASIAREAWTEVLRPALADRQGGALFIGTPQGFNHLHELVEGAEGRPDWKTFQFTTAEGGNVSLQEIESATHDLDERTFRQEFLATFETSGVGRAYYAFDRTHNVGKLQYNPGAPLVWALDFNMNPMCSTTSLGRLTLNILLSFAQFEREIIGERTSDKMSAARRKGKWVGGTPVLGYDVDPAGGRLIVNEKERRRVREIFALFLQHHSISAVVAELARRRWNTKSRKSEKGRAHTGRPFTKASLHRLLTNATYAGMVEHRGTMYTGEQAAIIELPMWQQVNDELRAGRRTATGAIRAPQNALLAGLLICRSCQRPMVPTYTAKRGRRYRYYVCQTVRRKGWSSCPSKSVPARMIEDAVVDQLRAALRAPETRERLNVSENDWQAFEERHLEVVRALVKEVSYDGPTGAVSLDLKRSEASHED